MKFPLEFDALDLVTDDLKEKLTPMSRRLKDVERERAARRKVRKRTKVAADSGAPKADKDVEMADVSASSSSGSVTAPPAEPASGDAEGKGKAVAEGELEEESVYREKELKELEALVDPSLKADFGCSVSGLYDLVGEYAPPLSRCLAV